jgi:alkylation response protein AidB-like acyl-CoA dehydrogenase
MVVVEAGDAVDRARAVAPKFAERAAAHDRDGSFPFENFDDLRDAGLLSLTVDPDAGGGGAGLGVTMRVLEEVGRGDASTALVLAMHYIYHGVLRGNHAGWPQATYERLCRESVEGIALINAMRVEPDLGSPARGGLPKTTGEPTPDGGWLLNGHKLYSTGSPICAYHLVWGRTAGEDPRVGYFIVPKDAPGLRIVETWDHLGMRATGSHDSIYENVELPHEFGVDLRPPAAWMVPDPVSEAWNALAIGAVYNGAARAAADWLKGYLHERVPSNLGASLATLPRFQSAVGEMESLLFTNDQLMLSLADGCDRDEYDPKGDSRFFMAKYVIASNAIKATDIAVSLIANPGITRHNPLERLYRDVLCGRVNYPQDDMVLLGAGRAALERAKPAG